MANDQKKSGGSRKYGRSYRKNKRSYFGPRKKGTSTRKGNFLVLGPVKLNGKRELVTQNELRR